MTPGCDLAAALEVALRRHALEPWFPRCVDARDGGFLCDFDRRWQPAGAQVRMLEFQARQTRVAAVALRLGLDAELWEPICRHGFAYLRDVMWDAQYGGWYAACERSGAPRERGDKHAHGIAYAILACLETAAALELPEAGGLARRAFEWLDVHAWDHGHGAYWGWLRRDGAPYVLLGEAPRAHDRIGVPFGAKDVNVGGDMVETLTELCRDETARLARERLAWLVAWLERAQRPDGSLPVYYTRELAPIGEHRHSGYALQATYRLPEARARLGAPLVLGAVERTLRAHALGNLGATGGPVGFERREEWWIAFEWLRSSAFAHALGGDEAAGHLDQVRAAWQRIQRFHLDDDFGGVYAVPQGPGAPSGKGDAWKDASHETLALSFAAAWLRGRNVESPLATNGVR